MNTLLQFFETSEAFRRGIAPIDDPHHDFNRILAGLTPEEARRAKRKFRKLWRRLARKVRVDGTIPNRLGQRNVPPIRTQLNARKVLVKNSLQALALRRVKESLGDKNE